MRWQRDWMDALRGATGTPTCGLRDARDIERFEVYRASYEANLCGALRDTYPVVSRLVGEDYFRQTAHAYLRAHPSRCGDIHEFGANFAPFIAALNSVVEVPYLPDVARLEWLAHQAFHATNAEPLTLSGLIELSPESYGGLCLLPSVRLMHSAFPVHRIWQANQESWAGDTVVSLDAGGVRLAVSRVGLEIVLLPLEAEAHELARALFEHGSLDAACEAMADADSLGRALHALIGAGLVATAGANRNTH
ncbi:MAG TPA: DNA-binding domain-containing protein [Thiobacillus sp.]|nr:DNA-binding domain-containing protein [Thiobacillus sp.]